MPLPNWGKEREENISVGQVDDDDVGHGQVREDSRIIKLWKRGKHYWCGFFFFGHG